MSCGIEHDEEGSAGLRLTARGSITTCTYRLDTDGRKNPRWQEIPRWQESSCWTGHPNYYQEHPPPWLENDGRRRYHLELHMCVWLYHLELHMMIIVDIM